MSLTLVDNKYLTGFSIADNFETKIVAKLTPYHSMPVGAGLDVNNNGTPDGEETPTPQEYLRIGEEWSIRSIDDVGDFNGDGITDLLYERQFTFLPPVVLLGSADGTMNQATLIGDAARETIGEAFHADFNGDGLIDIYGTVNGYAHRYPTTPSDQDGSFAGTGDLLLLNQGNNTFLAQSVPSMLEYQTGYALHYNHGGHYGDWDNDGDQDVLSIEANGLVGPDEGVVTVKRIALNNGDGTFTYSSSTIPSATAQPDTNPNVQFGQTPSARFADLNNDGIVDLTINTYTEGENAVLANGGIHIFINDGDGDLSNDVVIKTKTHWALENKELLNSTYDGLDFSSANLSSDFTSFFDVNDDGYLDILVGQKAGFDGFFGTAGGFQLFINQQGTSFVESTAEYFPNLERHFFLGEGSIPDVTRFNFADLNGDGKKDFIFEQGFNTEHDDGFYPYIMLNYEGKFYPISESDVAALVNRGEAGNGNFVTGDFNGDGKVDFASIGGVRDDLPGVWQDERSTADGVFLHLSNLTNPSSIVEDIRGTGRDDELVGSAYADRIIPGLGNDTIDGKDGLDSVVYWNGVDNFSYSKASSGLITVLSDTTRHQLTNIERLSFTDIKVAFDSENASSAGGIYRLYKATFNREPDHGGLGYWIAQADAGSKSAVQMAEDFTWSTEFQNLYNITTSDNYGTGTDVNSLVTGFYQNVLGRAPDQGGLDYYSGVIQTREKTVGRVLAEISDSQENYDNTIDLIQNGIQYDLWVG